MRCDSRAICKLWIVPAVVLLAVAWVLDAPLSTLPQAHAAPGDNAPEKKTVQTQDRTPISLTYYKSTQGKNAPVVVLLHMKDGNQLVWQGANGLAVRLQSSGFAVITVDLRRHGASQPGVAAAGNANQDGKKKDVGRKPAAASELRPADY